MAAIPFQYFDDLADHAQVNFLGHSQRLGDLEEFSRRYYATTAVNYPHQDFVVDHCLIRKPDHWLGIKHDPIVVQNLS